MTSDYTVLALGTKIEGGEIKVCPRCNRRGLHIDQDGHGFYTHFRIVSRDDPRNVLIQRIECYFSDAESDARVRARALPKSASPSN